MLPMLARYCLVLAALYACDKHGDPAATPSSGSAAAPAKAAPPPKIDCVKAIPKDVIAKHLAAAQTEWGEPFDNGEGSFITSCRFVDPPAKGRTIVRYKCGPTFANLDAYLGAVEPQIQGSNGSAFKFQRIDGIGRGAFRDKATVSALHRSMPCIIEVDEMGDRDVPDWTPLLKDLEAALTPAASA